MSQKRPVGKISKPPHRKARLQATVVAGIVFGSMVVLVLVWQRWDSTKVTAPVASPATPVAPAAESRLSDTEAQGAADALLAAVNPRLKENSHFPAYALEQLAWVEQEVGRGRLTIAFLFDPENIGLPRSVLMAASHLDGQPTIVIVRPRFEAFLRRHGRTTPPFTSQQTNDFAIGLIHEVNDLRNTTKNEPDPAAFYREESRAWKDVTLKVVRPLRASNQPMDREFVDVDDALRLCGDALPCPQLAQLVRLTR